MKDKQIQITTIQCPHCKLTIPKPDLRILRLLGDDTPKCPHCSGYIWDFMIWPQITYWQQ